MLVGYQPMAPYRRTRADAVAQRHQSYVACAPNVLKIGPWSVHILGPIIQEPNVEWPVRNSLNPIWIEWDLKGWTHLVHRRLAELSFGQSRFEGEPAANSPL